MIPIVFDLETTIRGGVHGPAAKHPDNRIVSVIWGTSPKEVQVKHEEDAKGVSVDGFLAQLQKCTHIVGHNLKFDLWYVWKEPIFQRWVINGGQIWDTQVAEYLLTGQQHRHARLSELEEKHLGKKQKIDRISEKYAEGIGADIILRDKELYEDYNKYCYQDGISTLLVFKAQHKLAAQKEQLAIIELFNDYLLSLIHMETTGILIDTDKAEDIQRDWNLKYIEHSEKAQEMLKTVWCDSELPEFNVNSVDHRSAVMYGGPVNCGKKKIPAGLYKNGNQKFKTVDNIKKISGFMLPTVGIRKLKKPGYWASDDEAITQLKKNTTSKQFLEYAEHLDQATTYKKAVNTDIKGILDYTLNEYLYPNFNNTAVVTGRLSSSRPNMQNKAKHSDLGKAIHTLFTAPEGWVCVQADFGQLEIWISALLSEDGQLLDDLLSGVDMHCLRVSYTVSESYEEVVELCKKHSKWKALRTSAKTFSYQRAYGAGLNTLVESTGLERSVVEQIIEKEEQRYPKASLFFQTVQRLAESSAKASRIIDIPTSIRPKNTYMDYELLPIFDNSGRKFYNKDYVRKIGFWRSPTGKLYHFPYTGRKNRGYINENISPTIVKNYPMQGAASEIQGATSYALLKACLLRQDKIRMINEIHDSKWFYIREDVLDKCIKYVHNTMSNVSPLFEKRFGIKIPFKFPVDIEAGPNFGELSEYKIN